MSGRALRILSMLRSIDGEDDVHTSSTGRTGHSGTDSSWNVTSTSSGPAGGRKPYFSQSIMTRENFPGNTKVHSNDIENVCTFDRSDTECIEPEVIFEGRDEDPDYSPPSWTSSCSSMSDEEGTVSDVSEDCISTRTIKNTKKRKLTTPKGIPNSWPAVVGTGAESLRIVTRESDIFLQDNVNARRGPTNPPVSPSTINSFIPHNELADSDVLENGDMTAEGTDAIKEACEEIVNELVQRAETPETESPRIVDNYDVPETHGSRWKQRNPQLWKCNVEKRKRSECLSYEIKKRERPGKAPKPVDCQKCRFKCSLKVTEVQRKEICFTYWGLGDFKRQKDFILGIVTSRIPERRRSLNDGNERSNSKSYHFDVNGDRVRVCQSFFVKTLCISKDVVSNAIKNKGKHGSYIGEDGRGKHEPANKTSEEALAFVKLHIESFPVVASHYCRSDTPRKYLEGTLSIEKMYELYLEDFKKKQEGEEPGNDEDSSGSKKAQSRRPVSLYIYKTVFGTQYNLSFFHPKKDRCQICENYDGASQDEKAKLQQDYDSHQMRKKDCNAAKSFDKDRAAKERNFLSVTFDLQSVLQIPSSDVSSMYYSRKICVYNLTVYEAAPPNDAHCYCWTELNGKRGSSEIGSCLFQFLTSLPSEITEISLFLDTCGGQNRNKLMLYLVQTTNLEVIEQKFLESGHSYMEVDSMHSAI